MSVFLHIAATTQQQQQFKNHHNKKWKIFFHKFLHCNVKREEENLTKKKNEIKCKVSTEAIMSVMMMELNIYFFI